MVLSFQIERYNLAPFSFRKSRQITSLQIWNERTIPPVLDKLNNIKRTVPTSGTVFASLYDARFTVFLVAVFAAVDFFLLV